MATRGIVARATNEGWEGRYAHWDNYPERMVYVLGELVARDGVGKVVETLIINNASWSSIDPFAKKGETGLCDPEAVVNGYGVIHLDSPLDETEPFTQNDTELAWAEWLYIIHDTILEVRRIERDENGNDITVYHNAFPWESIAVNEVEA
jgi:hypothetical protein